MSEASGLDREPGVAYRQKALFPEQFQGCRAPQSPFWEWPMVYCGQGPAAGLDKQREMGSDQLSAGIFAASVPDGRRGWEASPSLGCGTWLGKAAERGQDTAPGYRNLRQPRPACFPFTLTLSACRPSEPPCLLCCLCSHPQPLPRSWGRARTDAFLLLSPLFSLWGSARLRFSRTQGSGRQPGPRLDLLLLDFFSLPWGNY